MKKFLYTITCYMFRHIALQKTNKHDITYFMFGFLCSVFILRFLNDDISTVEATSQSFRPGNGELKKEVRFLRRPCFVICRQGAGSHGKHEPRQLATQSKFLFGYLRNANLNVAALLTIDMLQTADHSSIS